MAEHIEHVVIKADVRPFIAAMQRYAVAAGRLQWALFLGRHGHRMRHHRREDPQVSAMHAAYDRRRRARRRSGRRRSR